MNIESNLVNKRKQPTRAKTLDKSRFHTEDQKSISEESFTSSDDGSESKIGEIPKLRLKIDEISHEDENLQSSFSNQFDENQNIPIKLPQPHSQRHPQNIRSTAQENVVTIDNHEHTMAFEFTAEEIKEAFDTLDINKNEYITSAELTLFLDILGIGAKEEEIDEMIRMADKQGLGKVFYDEFLELGKGKLLSPIGVAYPPSIPLLERRNKKITPYSKDAFEQLDTLKPHEGKLAFLKDKPKDIKETSKPKRTQNIITSSNSISRETRIQHLKRFYESVMFKFPPLLEKYKANKNLGAFILEYNSFVEFFSIDDKKLAKSLFSLLLWPNTKFLDLRELLVNWVAMQNWSAVNKAYIAYHVIDLEEKGTIDFEGFMDIVVWLNIVCDRVKKERIVKKIWEKFKINLEESIDLGFYEKIVQNFSEVLFPDFNNEEADKKEKTNN